MLPGRRPRIAEVEPFRRPASVATSTSVQHPEPSSCSITASVSARPRPRPRSAGATQIVPTHPTRPETVATPVPTISPSRSARIGWQFRWPVAKRKKASRSPQSPRRTASACAATSAGSIGRIVVPVSRASCTSTQRSWQICCSSRPNGRLDGNVVGVGPTPGRTRPNRSPQRCRSVGVALPRDTCPNAIDKGTRAPHCRGRGSFSTSRRTVTGRF
jgi:hypothetical protein